MWTLPPGDADFAGRWKAIKRNFTHALVQQGVPVIPNAKGEYPLWQRRYWEHTIRDEDDWQRHVNYIHYNPVKHGVVPRVVAWPFSSFHRFAFRSRTTSTGICLIVRVIGAMVTALRTR